MQGDVNYNINVYRTNILGGQAANLVKRSIVQRQCLICNHFRCPLKSHASFARRLQENHKDGYRLHQIDDQKPDPFAKHPIHMDADLERLYAQSWLKWNSDFKGPERHLFPRSRFSALFSHACIDEALHYGGLSLIATQISMLRDGALDELVVKLQLQVISAQRRALADGMSDARVMTALCIMSNAYAANKAENLDAHLQLIVAWIEKCGVLQNLGMDGILADNLMYADHTRAIVYNSEPLYKIHLPALTSSTAPRPGKAYTDLKERGLISKEIESAANNYLILVGIFDLAARGRGTASQGTYFAYLANVVEYQLAVENAKQAGTNTLNECITLACLLGNHVLLRNYGQLAPSIPPLEARLWRCFEELRSKRFFASHKVQELEVYLTCIGTLTSVRRTSPYENKTIELMAEFREDTGKLVQAFYQVCDILENYGWSESACLMHYAKIWNRAVGDMKVEED